MGKLESRVLDMGLDVLDTEATDIVICSAMPTSYAEANATYALGRKVFGAGACFGSPADAVPNGRKVVSAAVADGMVEASGDATHWAAIDTVNTRLLAAGELAAAVTVTMGNDFTLGSFEITVPDQP